MTMSDSRRGQVRAVRLPHVMTDELDKVAAAVGGYSKAIEVLATEQQLPHDWFRENTCDVGVDVGVELDTRITFRLSVDTERALRAWGGRRPLNKIVRHLILYSFTDGLGAQTQPIPPSQVAPTRLPAKPAAATATAPSAGTVMVSVDTPARSRDAWSGLTASPLGS